MKLSTATIRGLELPPGKSEAIFFDDGVSGFGLRLRERGSRTWVFQYKLGAKQRRMSLGSANAIGVAGARKTAELLYARVKLGEDPASDKAESKAQAVKTFKAVADDYLAAQKPRMRPRSYAQIERHLLNHAKALHELQLSKIDRADIAAVTSGVTKNSGDATGNRVRATLSAYYAWTIRKGLTETNPVTGTERSKETSRERVLTPAELQAIWNALEDDHYGAIVKLLALTGQRASEIGGLCWSEIEDEAIVLTGVRTKNARAHRIPLSEAALAIVGHQPHRADRDLIFGFGEGPFAGWSKSKDKLDARITEVAGKSLPHWTVHDLRRTAATQMAGLGVQPHVIEAVLNHISGHKSGVAGIYNRGTYEAEKRTALDLWANHLLAIVEKRQSNVTPLKRA